MSTAIIHGMLLHPWGHWIVTKPGYGQSYWWPDMNMLSDWETARTFGKFPFHGLACTHEHPIGPLI
jgi:hypothetical protein